MNRENLINEMLQMQEMLDNEILHKKHTEVDRNLATLRLAILDEIGELNHELKKTWCWWKESQNRPDQKKVLGELVDVWHFVMSGYIEENRRKDSLSINKILEDSNKTWKLMKGMEANRYEYTIWKLMQALIFSCYSMALSDLVTLSRSLGYDISDVYQGYMDKNAENHIRANSDY